MVGNDPDAALRLAAFAWLDRASEGGERALSWAELTRGFSFGGEAIQLIGQKGIWKPRQMALPIAITTAAPKSSGGPAPYDDEVTDQGLLRYRYEGTDPNHHTNRWLRDCWREQIQMIYFHGVARGMYLATWPVLIAEDHPTELSVLVEISDPLRFRPDLPTHVADEAERRFYNRLIRERLEQAVFRHRVMTAYRESCAVCRLRHGELLDAAHIVAYADAGPSTVDNGLALCKIHHAAYDHNILGVSPDMQLHLRSDMLDEIDGPMLRYGLQEVHGRTLYLPHLPHDRPRREYVERRWEQFRMAG